MLGATAATGTAPAVWMIFETAVLRESSRRADDETASTKMIAAVSIFFFPLH